jgi:hypothetical protein
VLKKIERIKGQKQAISNNTKGLHDMTATHNTRKKNRWKLSKYTLASNKFLLPHVKAGITTDFWGTLEELIDSTENSTPHRPPTRGVQS